MDNIRLEIGFQIRDIRMEQGLKQQELADKAGITRANLCNIESGKYSVGLDVLDKITTALGKTIRIV